MVLASGPRVDLGLARERLHDGLGAQGLDLALVDHSGRNEVGDRVGLILGRGLAQAEVARLGPLHGRPLVDASAHGAYRALDRLALEDLLGGEAAPLEAREPVQLACRVGTVLRVAL